MVRKYLPFDALTAATFRSLPQVCFCGKLAFLHSLRCHVLAISDVVQSSHLMLACLENGNTNQRLQLGFSTDTRPARDSGEPGIFCFVVFSQRCWQPCLPGANHIRKDYFASLSLMAMKLLQSQLGLEETSLDQPHSNEPKRSGGLREICRKSRWKTSSLLGVIYFQGELGASSSRLGATGACAGEVNSDVRRLVLGAIGLESRRALPGL